MRQTQGARKDRRRPTMVDVASAAGVSLKTVSRVVNNDPTVAPDYAQKVVDAVATLGFRRNNIARTLRSGQSTATIGLVIEDLANPFYSTVASAIERVARDHDSLLITASSEENPERERQLILELLQRRVDGLLVVPAGADHGFLRREIEIGIPAVFIDRPPNGLIADSVLLDNVGGANAGVSRLIATGHSRIGLLLDSLAIFTMQERLEGAQRALRDGGLITDENLTRTSVHDPGQASLAVSEMLEMEAPPTAFFCANNRIAIGAALELARRRRRLPIVAFDDFEMSPLVRTPLTIVGYDNNELGRRAASLLLARINGDRSDPQTVVLPTKLREVLRA